MPIRIIKPEEWQRLFDEINEFKKLADTVVNNGIEIESFRYENIWSTATSMKNMMLMSIKESKRKSNKEKI